MHHTLRRGHAPETSTKLTVFQRLTIKKQSQTTQPTLKSNINTKSKPIISSTTSLLRSALSFRNTEKKIEKEVQKITFPSQKYNSVLFPVQYAQSGFIIEISEEGGNYCRIKMDYNQYDILVNEIQHSFAMPVMEMSIKQIKVLFSDRWSPCFSISIQRVKGKLIENKIETNSFLSSSCSKDIIEIDPWKEIEEAELRRKKMLLNSISKIKLQRNYSKTEIDETTSESSLLSSLVSPKKSQLKARMKLSNKSDYFFQLGTSLHLKQDKRKIQERNTSREQPLISDFEQRLQKTQQNREICGSDKVEQLIGQIRSPRKKRLFADEKQKSNVNQNGTNSKNPFSVLKLKQEVCSPKRG